MLSQKEGKSDPPDRGDAPVRRDADNDSLRLLVEQACMNWESDLRAFLAGILRNCHSLDDAFQRTVVRAIEAADSVRRETLRGWLFKIALNEARQILRDNRRDVFVQDRLISEENGRVWGIAGAASGAVDSGIVSEEIGAAIRRSLGRLPIEQQEVIRRRIYDEQTFSQISEDLNLPLGTVLTWMRRGLQRLREDSALKSLTENLRETL